MTTAPTLLPWAIRNGRGDAGQILGIVYAATSAIAAEVAVAAKLRDPKNRHDLFQAPPFEVERARQMGLRVIGAPAEVEKPPAKPARTNWEQLGGGEAESEDAEAAEEPASARARLCSTEGCRKILRESSVGDKCFKCRQRAGRVGEVSDRRPRPVPAPREAVRAPVSSAPAPLPDVKALPLEYLDACIDEVHRRAAEFERIRAKLSGPAAESRPESPAGLMNGGAP